VGTGRLTVPADTADRDENASLSKLILAAFEVFGFTH
jgi:hypothetical protein